MLNLGNGYMGVFVILFSVLPPPTLQLQHSLFLFLPYRIRKDKKYSTDHSIKYMMTVLINFSKILSRWPRTGMATGTQMSSVLFFHLQYVASALCFALAPTIMSGLHPAKRRKLPLKHFVEVAHSTVLIFLRPEFNHMVTISFKGLQNMCQLKFVDSLAKREVLLCVSQPHYPIHGYYTGLAHPTVLQLIVLNLKYKTSQFKEVFKKSN